MRPAVSPTFRNELANIVRQPERFTQYLWSAYVSRRERVWADVIPPPEPFTWDVWSAYRSGMVSVWPDVIRFRYQSTELQRRSVSQFAAFFRDDGPVGEELPILVEVPDLSNIETSYGSLVNTLKESYLRFDKVDPPSAEQIFVDRLAEFLSVGSSAAAQPNPTIVHSNRSGDIVIYAKGYFISTGTAFGVSTPASNYLAPGRYSFGIVDSGRHKWENIVWTCPTTVQLNLP